VVLDSRNIGDSAVCQSGSSLVAAALTKADAHLGVGQMTAGDLVLAWKSFLRCGVAYVVTALAVDWLPPIRWSTHGQYRRSRFSPKS
jgi:hypothetical protein